MSVEHSNTERNLPVWQHYLNGIAEAGDGSQR